jgi:hypothetical protein
MRTVILTALLLALLSPQLVSACSCREKPPAKEALKHSDAVFAGTVESITEAQLALSGSRYTSSWYRVVFRVSESWKGTNSTTLIVYTSTQSTACGFPFRVGSTYLVYAHETHQSKLTAPDLLTTSVCTRTAHRSQALDDIRTFGAGAKPKTP